MYIGERLSERKAKIIYEQIRKKGTISKQDLKDQTELTTSTLARLLDDLSEKGFISKVGLGQSTGGRRPVLYRTNPRHAFVFGLDISRVFSKLILCDMHLNKLDSQAWKMDSYMTPERLVEMAISAANQMLARHGIERSSILGMGIGAVGPLNRLRGELLAPIHFSADGWENVDICNRFECGLNIPVILDNGANTALLGEYWQDAVRPYEHLLYVHAGVGIRSAMMTNGKLVYGAVDMEGAAGQMIIQTDGMPPRDRSGNYGSWDSYVSFYALEEAAKSALKQGHASLLNKMAEQIEDITYPLLEKALLLGDSLAADIYNRTAVYFGIGLANLLNILHPQKVILGGPLFAGQQLVFTRAIEVAIRKTYHYPDYQAVFSQSRLGEDAVAIGAAVMVINQLTE